MSPYTVLKKYEEKNFSPPNIEVNIFTPNLFADNYNELDFGQHTRNVDIQRYNVFTLWKICTHFRTGIPGTGTGILV
jgi:hypothetical protein